MVLCRSTTNKLNLPCRTKSLPRKSAMFLGNLVRPQTNLKKSERSWFVNSSITSQNLKKES